MTHRHLVRRDILGLSAYAVFGLPITSLMAEEASDATYGALLQKYVSSSSDGINRVDYRRWHSQQADRSALDAYVKWLESRRPSAMAKDDAFAYWANLYNALTLKVILDNFPVKSIRDIRSDTSALNPKTWLGPWQSKFVKVEGNAMSLDDIEHGTLRAYFGEPRVHYVLNCASFGCPNLARKPWRAAGLDKGLDEAARAFVNHPRGVTIKADGSLKVSSIYRWFREDFGGDDAGILRHVKRYASGALLARLEAGARISEDDYNWTLNGSTSSGA